MSLFYKPRDGWFADVIPFYWAGEYHLFFLKDYRDIEAHGEGTPWFHVRTRDFVTFTDDREALPRGPRDAQDLYVFTGCVVEKDGQFHIFYTGHNQHLKGTDRPAEAIMHAVSDDLVTWAKAGVVLVADETRFERDDWRDPFVFWNDEAGEYWMLLAARLNRGPSNRRGCVALATSTDLVNWQHRDPLWAPSLYTTHECPDLFRIGPWWYLVYSEFSERSFTHYRMAKSLSGPWLAPRNDAFDARAFYAAKTASDGDRRFIFGWIPTRAGDTDSGHWQWGGHLAVHEIVQQPDGALVVRPPTEVVAQFDRTAEVRPVARIGDWQANAETISLSDTDGFAWCELAPESSSFCLSVTIDFAPRSRGVGVLLRADESLGHYYMLRIEPDNSRLVFDRWPRPGDVPFQFERPLDLRPGEPVTLRVIVDGSIIVAYANDIVALSARGYDHPAGRCGLFVSEGQATFSNLSLRLRDVT